MRNTNIGKTVLDFVSDHRKTIGDQYGKVVYLPNLFEFDEQHGSKLSSHKNYENFVFNGGRDDIISDVYARRTADEYVEQLDAVTKDICQYYLLFGRLPEFKQADRDDFTMEYSYLSLWLLFQQMEGRLPGLEEYISHGIQLNQKSFKDAFGLDWKMSRKFRGGIEYRFARNYWAMLRQDYAAFKIAHEYKMTVVTHYAFDVVSKVDAFCYLPDSDVKPIGIIYANSPAQFFTRIAVKERDMHPNLKKQMRYLHKTEGWLCDKDRIHVITDSDINTLYRSFIDAEADESLTLEKIKSSFACL